MALIRRDLEFMVVWNMGKYVLLLIFFFSSFF